MKEIKEGTFLRACENPLSMVQSIHFGNDYFGDFTSLVQVEGLFFGKSARTNYNNYDTEFFEIFYQFDNKQEAELYFNSAVKIAKEYNPKNKIYTSGF